MKRPNAREIRTELPRRRLHEAEQTRTVDAAQSARTAVGRGRGDTREPAAARPGPPPQLAGPRLAAAPIHSNRLTTGHPVETDLLCSERQLDMHSRHGQEEQMLSAVSVTEGETRVDIRAQALMNRGFLRVIHTGTREQVVVMTLPADAEIGEEVHSDADQLFVVVDGNGEARVGSLELAVEAGDLVFVAAGTRHNIINRATIPLRLITVFAPPAYAPGTVIETMPVHEPPIEEPWRAFPWVPESSGLDE